MSFFLVCKVTNNAKKIDVDEISYLKSQYSANNKDQITFIKHFSSIEEVSSFEEIFEELKTILKCVKEDENMNLRNKALFGGWTSVARMVYKRGKLIKRKSLPQRFDDWMYKELEIRKQRIYDYINLYELMSVAPKLLNCRVNMTYFVKNHEILMTYSKSEEQILWKHWFNCTCDSCNSYSSEINASPSGIEY